MNEQLKRCPFCGGEASLKHDNWSGHGEGGATSRVSCAECGASVRAGTYQPDDAAAINAWNARSCETKAPHIASANCWCQPERDSREPTVWIHRERH